MRSRLRGFAVALTVGWTAVILLVTLWPVDPVPVPMGSLCLICGARGTADAILNLGFFVPLGVGVGLLWGWRAAALASLLLSTGVEMAQLGLPGRYPTLGDVVFNTAGGALGAGLLPALRAAPAFLAAPSGRGRWAARAVSVALLVLPVLLLAPRFPDTRWWGQWTPYLALMDPYDGRVLEASVGGVPVPGGPLDDSDGVRRALREGGHVRVRFVTGRSPGRLAPLFAIYDGDQRQILLVGVEGEAVVYYRRSLATALALDHPGLAWPRVLDLPPGDTATLRVARHRAGVCLTVGEGERCGTALGAGDGWRLALDPGPAELPRRAGLLLGVLWTCLVAVPAGAVARSVPRALVAGLLLGGAGVGAAWLVPELAADPGTLLGTCLGAVAGWLAARLVVRRVHLG